MKKPILFIAISLFSLNLFASERADLVPFETTTPRAYSSGDTELEVKSSEPPAPQYTGPIYDVQGEDGMLPTNRAVQEQIELEDQDMAILEGN